MSYTVRQRGGLMILVSRPYKTVTLRYVSPKGFFNLSWRVY